MRTLLIIVVSILLLASFLFMFISSPEALAPDVSESETTKETTTLSDHEEPLLEIVLEELVVPWDIAFLSPSVFLLTERGGVVRRIDRINNSNEIILHKGVSSRGEGGLLGITLHPHFKENGYVYLYSSIRKEGQGETRNTVERFILQEDALLFDRTIIQNIPGALYHDGGRMAFGPDKKLYITTGDARTPSFAQDLSSLAGKILRLNDDGTIPRDNPYHTAIYSWGHRNPQGITWDSEGNLWSTEHGRSGLFSGLDEVNLIESGNNYGWPTIEGDERREGMESPVLHSTPQVTWAPASALYFDGHIYFGGLKGERMYRLSVSGGEVGPLEEFFVEELGRIRTLALGLDGYIYAMTSNKDGRGKPLHSDDRLVRIHPTCFEGVLCTLPSKDEL